MPQRRRAPCRRGPAREVRAREPASLDCAPRGTTRCSNESRLSNSLLQSPERWRSRVAGGSDESDQASCASSLPASRFPPMDSEPLIYRDEVTAILIGLAD